LFLTIQAASTSAAPAEPAKEVVFREGLVITSVGRYGRNPRFTSIRSKRCSSKLNGSHPPRAMSFSGQTGRIGRGRPLRPPPRERSRDPPVGLQRTAREAEGPICMFPSFPRRTTSRSWRPPARMRSM
jgi:hypothetical protein